MEDIALLNTGIVLADGHTSDMRNYAHRGVKLYIATGAFGVSESTMTVVIQGKDPVSGAYYTILTSASLVASKDVGSAAGNLLTVYPGLVAVTNQVVNDILPATWRVAWNASNWGTGGSTLGIVASLII
jgi:hypothetical protein